MDKRKCLACNEPIVGRVDKRYCSDACRTLYHNQRYSGSANIVKKIDGILKQNRRVLRDILDGNLRRKIEKTALIDKGLDFDFFTNQFIHPDGQIYFFIYEYGYLSKDDQEYLVFCSKQLESV